MRTPELKKTNHVLTMLKRLTRSENVDLEPNYSAMVVIYIQNTIEKSNGKPWLHGGDVGAAPFVIDVYTLFYVRHAIKLLSRRGFFKYVLG